MRPTLLRPSLIGSAALMALSATAPARAADGAPAASPPAPAASAAAGQDAAAQSVVITRKTMADDGHSDAATKLDLSLRETPQSVTVMTRERLDDQNLTSLRSVLDNTPGIYSSAFDSERVVFYARGFRIDTLTVDGVPAMANFDTGSLDETLDTAVYDRIDIVRGATGLMSGAGSPAASVNLVRKHAGRTAAFEADLTLGSWQDKRVDLDATMPLTSDGRIRARLVGVAEDSHSYQRFYDKRTGVLYGIVDADLTPDTTLSLGVDVQKHRPHGTTWGSFPMFYADGSRTDFPTSVSTAANWTHWNKDTTDVFAELQHRFDGGWQLKATLDNRRYAESMALLYLYGYPDRATGEGMGASAYASDAKIRETALDVYASGPFELFGRRHELVLGYNGSRGRNKGEDADADEVADVGDFLQWSGHYPKPAFPSPENPMSDIRTTQDGAYVAGRFSLADPLHLVLGARAARWKVDSFYEYDSPTDNDYGFHRVIPYAGAVWDVDAHLSAFTSFTGIFAPQSARDADGHYLPPVTGRSLEAGIKGESFDRRLNTSLTVFRTQQRNLASPVYNDDGSIATLPGTDISISTPSGRVVSRGFELEADGRIATDWTASFGWTHSFSRDDGGYAYNTFIPVTLVRTFLTWSPQIAGHKASFGAGLNWQSGSTTTVAQPDGVVTEDGQETQPAALHQPSVALVSAMARWHLTDNASVQFNVNNLFGRKYYVLDQYDNTYYGAPVNGALTLRLTY